MRSQSVECRSDQTTLESHDRDSSPDQRSMWIQTERARDVVELATCLWITQRQEEAHTWIDDSREPPD